MTNAANKTYFSGTANTTAEAEFTNKPFRTIGQSDIVHLKSMAVKSPRNRYRICLHNNHGSTIQEMLICLKGFNYFHPHRHPGNRSESYHLIEGRMDVYLLDEHGGLIEKIELAAPDFSRTTSEPFMYRVSDSIYHFTVPRSEWTIYHEVLTGPWGPEAIQYAPFAPGENQPDGVNAFVKKITGLPPVALTNQR